MLDPAADVVGCRPRTGRDDADAVAQPPLQLFQHDERELQQFRQ